MSHIVAVRDVNDIDGCQRVAMGDVDRPNGVVRYRSRQLLCHSTAGLWGLAAALIPVASGHWGTVVCSHRPIYFLSPFDQTEMSFSHSSPQGTLWDSASPKHVVNALSAAQLDALHLRACVRALACLRTCARVRACVHPCVRPSSRRSVNIVAPSALLFEQFFFTPSSRNTAGLFSSAGQVGTRCYPAPSCGGCCLPRINRCGSANRFFAPWLANESWGCSSLVGVDQ